MLQTEEIYHTVLDKRGVQQCRHKAEKCWYVCLVILNFMIVFGIFSLVITDKTENELYFQELKTNIIQYVNEDSGEENKAKREQIEEDLDKKMEKIPFAVQSSIYILGLIVALPFILSYIYASYRSMSVRITEENFPEIDAIVKEYVDRLGMKAVPAVYLVQGNGLLNAFASCIPFKQYIELYADLVEVAYREHQDMESLRFIIAHEMAHIYLGHAKLSYNYSILFANMIPIFSTAASRAREYSCDRIAQKLSGSDGIDAVLSLIAGIHLYKKVDRVDYMVQARSVKGLFVWCYNIMSSHPIMTKRILALQMKEGSGKLF